MMNQKKLAYISVCCLMIVVAACVASTGGQPGKAPLSVETILTSQICLPSADSWTVTWISSQDEFQKMFARARSNRIGGPSQGPPSIDFASNGVLAVEMGEKPTAGYGFDTDALTVSITEDTAVVKLPHRQPVPGTATAQMVTSPCILLQLSKGGYRSIRVVDQNGRTLSEVTVP